MKKFIFILFFLLGIGTTNAQLVNFDSPRVKDIYGLVTNPPYTFIQGYNATYSGSGGFSYTTNTSYIFNFCFVKGMTFVSFSNPILKSSYQTTSGVFMFTSNPWLAGNVSDTLVIGRITCDDGLTSQGTDLSNYYNSGAIDSMILSLSNQITNWTGSMNTSNYIINENGISEKVLTQEFLLQFYSTQLAILILIMCIKYFEIFSFGNRFYFFK